MTGLIIDCFAGGGGASTGIEQALGRPIDIAINHDPEAVAMHEANHPATRHYCESIFDVDPVEACAGRPVDFAWFSPDCTHHSRARGGKPRSKEIRGLAWVVVKWAAAVRPAVIMLENVEEFATWGPLDEAGIPIASKRGETFAEWLSQLRGLGYTVDYRSLVAADYGAPTTRKRLFLIARCDGEPIVWPTPTHGKGRARPWVPASEIIDWTIPCPSIFGRKKPLADKTLIRIATGVRRYVIDTPTPFVVGNVAASMVQTGYGEREGQAPRALDIRKPLGTVVAQGAKHALVAAFLTKHYGGVVGHGVERAIGTITAQDHHALTTATLAREGSDRVLSFLAQYAPANQSSLFGRDLVMVRGEPHSIVDIGSRMLTPHELFAAQGFPRDYVIDPSFNGKPLSKTAQIAKAGNSVCPAMSRSLVGANLYLQQEAAE